MNIPARGLAAMLLAGAATFATTDAGGANYNWVVSSSGDWSTATCWSSSSVPTSNGYAYIINGGTATVTQAGEACLQLAIGGSGSSAVQMNSGSLIVGSTSDPTYELVGWTGPGNFVQTGGTHSVAVGLLLGNNGGGGGGSGSYTLSGGSLYAASLYVGNLMPGAFTQSAGTCSTADLDVGEGAATGSYTLKGSGILYAKFEYVGDEDTGVFTQSGGTNEAPNGILFCQNSGAGTYNLQGGLLDVGSLTQYAGSASLVISGGTLRSEPNSSIGVPITLPAGGNALLDTGGTLNISTGLSGSGSLTKSGSGILVLSGTNGYSGGTSVSEGTLVFAHPYSVPNGARITVGSHASFYFDSVRSDGLVSGNVQPVPEPSTAALVVVSVVGLVSLRRLRAARASVRRSTHRSPRNA